MSTCWTWIEESAINGVAHTARAMRDKRYFRAALWMFVTVGLWGATTFLLYGVVADYWSYPVLTKVEVQYQTDGVDFPSVQFCNHNPLKCSDMFKLSFHFDDLWKASGCRVGVQIERYIKKILNDFELDLSPAEAAEFTNVLPDLHGDTQGSAPMVILWAHLYLDSQSVVAMMMKPAFGKMLERLEAFVMNGAVDARRPIWSNFTTNYTVEHMHAVDHLIKARRLWNLRTKLLPSLMMVRNMDENATTGVLTGEELAYVTARAYLTFYSADNLSDAADLRSMWMKAMSMENPTMWQNVSANARLLSLTAEYVKFFEQNILQPLHDVPSALWLYGKARATRLSVDIILTNTDLVLNWSSPSSNVSISPAILDAFRGISSKNVDLIEVTGKDDGIELLLQDQYVLNSNEFHLAALKRLDSLVMLLGDTVNDTLRICIFRGKPCDRAEIVQVLSLQYGHCHVFNPLKLASQGKPSSKRKRTLEEGLTGGLTLLLAIHEEEYVRVPGHVTTTGARIAISPYGSPPNIDEEGIDLVPGQSTNIVLRQRRVERLPHPHPSNCQMDWTDSPYRFLDYEYDYNTCQRFCLGHRILEKCGCLDPATNAQEIEFSNGTRVSWNVTRWCDFSKLNTVDAVCANSIRLRENPDGSPKARAACACRPACRLNGYEMRLSASSYPAKGFVVSDKNHKKSRLDEECDEEKSPFLRERLAESASLHSFSLQQNWDSMKVSLVEVKIYFSSFDLLKTTEEQRYTPLTMASDVGGAIGLLLGLCGINIIELILMAWDMLAGATKKTHAADGQSLANNKGGFIEVKPSSTGQDPRQAEILNSKHLALMQAAASLDQEIARQQWLRPKWN